VSHLDVFQDAPEANMLSLCRAWLRRLVSGLSTRRPGFVPGSVHVGFVVNKVALEQGFLRVLRVFLSISFHHGSSYAHTIWGMDSRPVGDLSSETQSHPLFINNNKQQNLRITGSAYNGIFCERTLVLSTDHQLIPAGCKRP
jgi:hypothetical protein